MLKRLKEKQLDALTQSVESKGGEETECVLLPKCEIRLGKKESTPLILCCRMWRWPDVTSLTELKRLPCCTTAGDPAYECCNPHHWSLLLQPDISMLPSGWEELEKAKYTDDLDRPPDEAVSMETGMTPTPRRNEFSDISSQFASGADTGQSTLNGHWCTLAYWELRQRMGRLLTVFDSFINIYEYLPRGDGLCLQVLQESAETDSVRRTREKIGFGVILSREGDAVWLYNRSQFAIFVHSPTLECPNRRTLNVCKVMPGYSLKIYDYNRRHFLDNIHDPKYLDGPYDPFSVRVSFAKGWGPHYSRQVITSCPCWLEIMLNIDR
ncbi:mothers against decapentaplegic homolog 6-like isoform X2 [Mercenaria mercenaria]|nr:mothers against decapentaplegic homolog 6-like isoform X2 [Mercenaria mercenaria]XP_045184895.1 mothers against decapentaplegic homolog 6-like isoform X2 [Mercenaria mercenaria]